MTNVVARRSEFEQLESRRILAGLTPSTGADIVAQPDHITAKCGDTVRFDVTRNDFTTGHIAQPGGIATRPVKDPSSVRVTGAPDGLVDKGNGRFTYVHFQNRPLEPVTFHYAISDTTGQLTDTSTVTIRRGPSTTAANDEWTVVPDRDSIRDPLANDTFSGSVALQIVSGPDRGDAYVNGDHIVYQPDQSNEPPYGTSLTYSITDENGCSDSATVNIVVKNPSGRSAPDPVGPERKPNAPGPVTTGQAAANFINAGTVAIQPLTGHFIAAEGGGGGEVNANRALIGEWEAWEVIPLGGNQVAIRSPNGHYWSTDADGGTTIVADRTELLGWERFQVIGLDDDATFALLAHNGKYVSAINGGGESLAAQGETIQGWERFTFVRNQAPRANDDSYRVTPGESLVLPVRENDSDPNGDFMVVNGFTDPAHGTLRRSERHPNRLVYTPDPGFVGTDSFSYTVNDGRGGQTSAAVVIDVTGQAAANFINAGTVAIQPLTGHFIAAEGGGGGEVNANRALIGEWEAWEVIPLGGNQVAIRSPNGHYWSTDADGGTTIVADRTELLGWERFQVIGLDDDATFALLAHNGKYVSAINGGGESLAAQGETIQGWERFTFVRNQAPRANDDSYRVTPGESLVLPVRENDSDPNGDFMVVNGFTDPAHGTLRRSERHPNRLVYTPDPGFVGTDSFSYTVNDGRGGQTSAVVTLLVTPFVAPDLSPRILGDANVDGVFDSADLVRVFGLGKYDDGIPGNATWNDGDWNGDGDFDSADLVAAFAAGHYVGNQDASAIAAAIDLAFASDDNPLND